MKKISKMITNLIKGLLKSLFNHKEHKEGTKDTKLKPCIIVLCELCLKPTLQSGRGAKIAHRAIS